MTTCVLVHGTFARNAAWTRDGSRFRTALAGHFADNATPLSFERLEWSGWNTRRSRLKAATELSQLVSQIKKDKPNDEIILIGHSHGGSILAYFSKVYPAMAEKISGYVFLSTPFVAVRLRDNIWDTLNCLIFFMLFLLVDYSMSFFFEAWNNDKRLTPSALSGLNTLLLIFLWLHVISANLALKLSEPLQKRLAAHIGQSQTADFRAPRTLIVQMVGDEVTVAFSFARAFEIVANRLAMASQKIANWLRHYSNRQFAKTGRYLLSTFLVMEIIFWQSLDSFPTQFQWVTTNFVIILLGSFCGLAGLLYFGTTLLLMLTQSVILIGFGWISLLDAIFCEVSVTVAPFGHGDLVSLDWSVSTDGDRNVMSHSGSYANTEALKTIAEWIRSRDVTNSS